MIRSRNDYLSYLAADRDALGHNGRDLRARLFDEVWRFERSLRRLEYSLNCRPRMVALLFTYLHRRQAIRLGFTIPPNVFGPGLSIAHYGTIVVNAGTRVGARCRLHVGVNIGTAAGGHDEAPTIGDDAYLAPGAKLFGPITIGDRCKVGANAVVTKSFPDADLTLLGIPAVKSSAADHL